MAKTKQGMRDVDSYTIRGTTRSSEIRITPFPLPPPLFMSPSPARNLMQCPRFELGDCVLMRPSDTGKSPYVARIEGMESDGRGNVKVKVRWYYRPEEAQGGRRQFHGAKELFLSDHMDTFKEYTKLNNVGTDDFFCRFDYKAATGAFHPDRVAVYCKCEMPYNPDDLMVQCDESKDWFHPNCVNMTIEQAKILDHFMCSDCGKENGAKRPSGAHPTSPKPEPKAVTKRQRR